MCMYMCSVYVYFYVHIYIYKSIHTSRMNRAAPFWAKKQLGQEKCARSCCRKIAVPRKPFPSVLGTTTFQEICLCSARNSRHADSNNACRL